jgi:hypothetical protein
LDKYSQENALVVLLNESHFNSKTVPTKTRIGLNNLGQIPSTTTIVTK